MWHTIPNFSNYEVSDEGYVRRVGASTALKAQISGRGYAYVTLYNADGSKMLLLHRVVANLYVPNLFGKACVDHIDGNKLNNSAANLQWLSNAENLRRPNTKHKRRRVQQVKQGTVVATYASASEAARAVRGSQGNISACCRGVQYCRTYKNFEWRYIDAD